MKFAFLQSVHQKIQVGFSQFSRKVRPTFEVGA